VHTPGVTSRRSRYARFNTAAGLVSIVLVGFGLRYGGEALVVSRQIEEPDVIVVLASHELERLPVAAQLARRYPAAQVLLTLPVEVTAHNCYDCSERVRWLGDAGVERERVTVLPQRVTNTYDEAKATTAFVSRQRIDRLVIVTSPYHGRRALATFRHEFKLAGVGTELGLATPLSGVDPMRWWLRRYDREYVTHEWVGIVYYAIRLGVPPMM
jgi:uncharacterized SAM-binding protein YcdF (DUF218 family)